MADSCQCMAKPIQYSKVKKKNFFLNSKKKKKKRVLPTIPALSGGPTLDKPQHFYES